MKAKRYLIYGLSKSGEAAFNLLYNKKDTFFLFDKNVLKQNEFEVKNIDKSNVCILKSINKETLKQVNTIILSPGVSIYEPEIKYAKKLNIEVISELELGFKFCKNKIIAITGTNGKTTTISLLHEIFSCAGKRSLKVGNIGLPLSQAIKTQKQKTIFLCEVSSFQLEAINKFRPDVAAILNITPDHIDRHKSFLNYKKAKLNILKNTTNKQKIVLNSNIKLNLKNNNNVFYFSLKNEETCCFYKENKIYYKNKHSNKKTEFLLNNCKLLGKHNVENIMAAIIICKIFKIKDKFIQKGIDLFKPISHRIEKVFEINGSEFYDDSKATNIDSTLKAINCFDKEIFLILCGCDKGYGFDEIFNKLPKNVVKIFACGGISKKIKKSADKFNKEISIFKNLKQTIFEACKIISKNQVLLLSPGSASFDEFKSYEERGEKFLSYIKEYYEKC